MFQLLGMQCNPTKVLGIHSDVLLTVLDASARRAGPRTPQLESKNFFHKLYLYQLPSYLNRDEQSVLTYIVSTI